ncbi:GNAT family N-acetyltransferase [Clostridium magnum]|uniref:Acetyltransferase YpeA n=1 Tax=Clostridium magnum DSM 2767 TaxID=1121326 RepID=A0A161X607_9CLOT|nr:GNAT family N-acetyltransferase [Clostridium magnum]KZL89436.1 acetyltransferase YpeA [Clostridium magnum DSM 2767]SHI20370.1 Acetyltransferase (GNAT) family protein [Clostridium magnum DSM 2767]
MISYKRCSEIDVDLVYDAFQIGFSDYIIKVQMPKELFINRFFHTEGNSLERSFIALYKNKAIGIVLGGIKQYEGIKTMRCGTLAIDPQHRGKGIGQRLMKLHREEAIKHKCKQLFLEVIKGNDRAISFYKKIGYENIFNLTYFSLSTFDVLDKSNKLGVNIKQTDIKELKLVREKIKDIHVNWQNDIEYIEKSKGQITLAAYIKEKIAGIISINENTRINFLWVENGLRHNRIGTNLIARAVKELNLSKVTIGFPNNASIQGFVNYMGFKREAIAQYEMYYTL